MWTQPCNFAIRLIYAINTKYVYYQKSPSDGIGVKYSGSIPQVLDKVATNDNNGTKDLYNHHPGIGTNIQDLLNFHDLLDIGGEIILCLYVNTIDIFRYGGGWIKMNAYPYSHQAIFGNNAPVKIDASAVDRDASQVLSFTTSLHACIFNCINLCL